MATKLLTKKELEYLNDVHQNINPYFTYTIRKLDYKLEKCKTEKCKKWTEEGDGHRVRR